MDDTLDNRHRLACAWSRDDEHRTVNIVDDFKFIGIYKKRAHFPSRALP
jgi:hypothetical protein